MSQHPTAVDWERREFVTTVQYNIAAVVDFLNEFDQLTRLKLANLNQKLMKLERALDYIEASISNVTQPNNEIDEPGAQ